MEIQWNNDEENFIREIFDYFNGRVNMFQRARLFINWCELQTSVNGGFTTNPNCVIIYPKVIARYSINYGNYVFNLFLIIIHELYHVDQNIIMDRMLDPDYKAMIENTVEVQSASYLYNHLQEIHDVFGIDLYMNDIDSYINYFCDGNLYHRQKYINHIISVIYDMVYKDYSERKYASISIPIIDYFNDPFSKISIIINGKEIIIKDKDRIQDVNILNDILYDNYFSRNYICYSKTDINTDEHELSFEITADLYNFAIQQVKGE